MIRRAVLASALCLAAATSAMAGPMGPGAGQLPHGFVYSRGAASFESFEWTPLDFAAFGAYGGDFANVRRAVGRFEFFEDPAVPPTLTGPDDEQQLAQALLSVPYFEELPSEGALFDELPVGIDQQVSTIPEPGALALIGMGLLGLSRSLRRRMRPDR